MLGAFDRAERDGVDHEPRFGACLDDEKAPNPTHANC